MPPELAAQAEARFGCEVREVFGSTETCVFARRRTARDDAWTPLPGVRLAPQPDGTAVHAAHLAEPIVLSDLMEVHAERSNVRPASVDIGFTFQTQQADNQLLVNDGETAVIGGLTVTEVTVTKSGIPFLVDLPILGKLFGFTSQQENRRDLLILITPHIIDDLTSPIGQ
jgi:hypothetical protein